MAWRTELMMGVGLFLFAGTICQAANRVLENLAHEVRKDLPDGWSLSTTEHHWILRREKPVTFYNTISLPPFESEAELKEYVRESAYEETYMVVLRFGRKIPPMQFEQWQRDNRREQDRYDKLRRGVSDIRHKFDQFLPSNKEEEKRVEQFEKAAAQIHQHELPEFHYGPYSVYVETTQDWSCAFFDSGEGRECRRVQNLILDRFSSYGQ